MPRRSLKAAANKIEPFRVESDASDGGAEKVSNLEEVRKCSNRSISPVAVLSVIDWNAAFGSLKSPLL